MSMRVNVPLSKSRPPRSTPLETAAPTPLSVSCSVTVSKYRVPIRRER